MLIICLDRNLGIFTFSQKGIEKNFSLAPENKMLELSKKFEQIWNDVIMTSLILDILDLQTKVEILFIVGKEAGFTDIRIISIWLNSLSLFKSTLSFSKSENKQLKQSEIPEIALAKYLDFQGNIGDQEYLSDNLSKILTDVVWGKTLDSAIYTREPKITMKVTP